jgi:beta-glucanase (GH16 family)
MISKARPRRTPWLPLVAALAAAVPCQGAWAQASVSSAEHLPVGQEGDWTLVFNDEFDGTTLDEAKWVTCYWWDRDGCTNLGNNEEQWYLPDGVIVDDGILRLRAERRTVRGHEGRRFHYTSGMVSTGRVTSSRRVPTKFEFQYGYAEIRAKAPAGKGLWAAFWMLPSSQRSKPEIDILEIIGDETDVLPMHYHYAEGRHDFSRGEDWEGPDFSRDWHTFAIDWQPEHITWYVDGVERWRYTDREHIAAQPMYLLANLAVGGDWPGSPNDETPFPSDFEIDYVRVWQRAD